MLAAESSAAKAAESLLAEPLAAEPDVLLQVHGNLARIILNRPKSLNALTHGMIRAISAALTEWAADPSVQTVLLTGSGDRGLCAGGDIVSIYRDSPGASAQFWADEYTLNAKIRRYPKPFVALMDGIVLGGGVGLSAHASHRVVTERTRLGMPETTIGFVPDVGGTYLLSRAPGELGTHAALTATMISGADAIALGLADTFVPSEQIARLVKALHDHSAETAIAAVAADAPGALLLADRDWIDECYSGDRVEDIVARLQASSVDAARATAELILAKSPTALKVALASLRRARHLDTLERVLEQEYRVSLRMLAGHDTKEGIRAQVIDKDRSPAWEPPTLAAVSNDEVATYFADLGEGELRLNSEQSGR